MSIAAPAPAPKKSREDDDLDIGRVADLLGGAKTLGFRVATPLEAHELIVEGLPGVALHHLVDGLSVLDTEIALERGVGLSLRTLQRSKLKPGQPLSNDVGGRTWKFAEILANATAIFGTQAAAERWLQSPAMGLDDRRPIDLLGTPAGVEIVETFLKRLEYGVYA